VSEVTRRLRQLEELRALCRRGAVARALDLAFAHFADFGRDDEVVDLLALAIEQAGLPEEVCRRFVELRVSQR
jgi:hypothetical protein